MRKFLFKILIYVIPIIGVSWLLQYFIDTGLQKSNFEAYGIWNEIFQGKINADIIVQGTSRALVQFDTKIIENYTGLSCYNLGISGGRFLMQKAKWDTYIANNKSPKIIIQNVDILSLEKEQYIFGKEQYLPYLSQYTISTNLELVDKKIWLEKIIPLYKYRGFRSIVLEGLKSYFNINPNTDNNNSYHGYAGMHKVWNDDFTKFKAQYDQLVMGSENLKFGFGFLEGLIKECKEKGIKIILVHAPMYSELLGIIPQKHFVDSVFSSIANKYNMQYWDYTGDSLSYNKKYFYNSTHLNIEGAEIFSKHLANDLIIYIDKNDIQKISIVR